MMTFERIVNAQGLWGVLLPACVQPQPRQFLLWTTRFTDPQIERALTRAHRKFAGQSTVPNPDDIGRYVTGVLLNLEREQSTSPHGNVSVAAI